MALSPIGDLGIALKADIDDYQKSMATASDTTRSITGLFRNLGSAVKNTGLLITAGAALAGGAMLGLSFKAQKVNSAFREVDTISREVNDAQGEYSQLVSDLNTEFGLQADRLEVIDGLYQSVSAGVTEGADSQREFLTTAAKLAKVGRVDLATSVDVLSTVMNTYGLETEEATDVSRSLFQTVQFGKVRMEELAPVLGRVAALGSDMSVQIDEIGASMAVLTRTGFRARVAATGLRNIFRAMMRPSETMQQLLRDIALENEDIAEQWNNQSELGNDLAQTYRDAAKAVKELESAQQSARRTQEENSLAIQRARLAITAIEEDRVDQLGDAQTKQLARSNTIEELEQNISDYRFELKEARITEEDHRLEQEKKQKQLKNLREDFKKNVDINGNLGQSIGNLVLEEQNFVETLVDLRKRADEQNIAFNELFPRTRALQGALALVGEDGQGLVDIFKKMQEGTFDVKEEWEKLDQSAKDNFDSFEDFKESTEAVQEGDLDRWFEEATGQQATMRNSIAKLREVVADLGQVFSQDIVDALSNFANSIEKVSKFAKSMDESLRSNISQFAMLAVGLGLLIGPLLFFTGQLAIIASALGPAVIPVLAVMGTLFGVFASALKTAISGGEGASDMFNTMRVAIGKIRSIIGELRGAFSIVFPALISAGESLMSVLFAVKDSVAGVLNESSGRVGPLLNIAFAFQSMFFAVSNFLDKNKELIADGLATLAEILLSEVIPNLVDFLKGILQVVAEIDPRPFIALAGVLGTMAIKFVQVLGFIGRFMQKHDKLIGTLITATVVGLGFLAFLGSLAPLFSALATGVAFVGAVLGATLVPGMSALGVASASLTALFSGFIGTLSTVIPFFGLLSKGASIALTGIKLLAGGLSILVGAISAPVAVIGVLIAILVAMIASAYIARDEIIEIFSTIKRDILSIVDTLKAYWNKELTLEEAGNKIIETLVSGMLERISLVIEAAKTVAGTVKEFLGFGSSPEGLSEEYNPDNWGKNVGISFSEGIGKSEGEVDSAVNDVVPKPEDFETGISEEELLSNEASADLGALERNSISFGRDQNNARAGSGSKDRGGEGVVIEEGAIDVGPFEGISDEELPEKVQEEVEKSLDDIIEEVEGSGYSSMQQGGGGNVI